MFRRYLTRRVKSYPSLCATFCFYAFSSLLYFVDPDIRSRVESGSPSPSQPTRNIVTLGCNLEPTVSDTNRTCSSAIGQRSAMEILSSTSAYLPTSRADRATSSFHFNLPGDGSTPGVYTTSIGTLPAVQATTATIGPTHMESAQGLRLPEMQLYRGVTVSHPGSFRQDILSPAPTDQSAYWCTPRTYQQLPSVPSVPSSTADPSGGALSTRSNSATRLGSLATAKNSRRAALVSLNKARPACLKFQDA